MVWPCGTDQQRVSERGKVFSVDHQELIASCIVVQGELTGPAVFVAFLAMMMGSMSELSCLLVRMSCVLIQMA